LATSSTSTGDGDGGEGRGGRRRWRAGAIGAAIVAVALVGAAATWIVQRPSNRQDTVNCFASASLDGDVAQPAAAGGDPVEACREIWRTGDFKDWGNPSSLAACVLNGGDIGVFPGDASVCDRLGLPRLVTDDGTGDPQVAELIDSLTLDLTLPNCVDVAEAADLVRERLDQLGLEGWVLIAPATTVADRPCTSIAFDPPAKTITLVPIPGP
jgi:hypothetical protein